MIKLFKTPSLVSSDPKNELSLYFNNDAQGGSDLTYLYNSITVPIEDWIYDQ